MKTSTEQPANLDEMFERSLDSIAKTRRDAWFGMCGSALFIATLWRGEALAQMSGVPRGVIMLIGMAPFMFGTVQSWLEGRKQKARVEAEVARRELEAKSKPPLPTLPDKPLPAIPPTTTSQFFRVFAWMMLGALCSVEFFIFIVLLATMQKGEQLAYWLGAPTWIIYAIGFTPALLYTVYLLWSQRQREAKRKAAAASHLQA